MLPESPRRDNLLPNHRVGINQDDRYLVCTLPVAAPEIILHEAQYYIAALNQGALDGIRIAKLKWVKK